MNYLDPSMSSIRGTIEPNFTHGQTNQIIQDKHTLEYPNIFKTN